MIAGLQEVMCWLDLEPVYSVNIWGPCCRSYLHTDKNRDAIFFSFYYLYRYRWTMPEDCAKKW
jgi:hypothetical protein